jgi:hypothetical protein
MKSDENRCRCGHRHESKEPHPCHGNGYKCRQPARIRFYNARPVCLAGVQTKFGVDSTWACDACWAWYVSPTDSDPPWNTEPPDEVA